MLTPNKTLTLSIFSKVPFWILLSSIHFLFFVFQLLKQQYFTDDSVEYWREAYNLWVYQKAYCGDVTKVIELDFYSKRPILYPLLLVGFRFLPIWVYLLFQNVLAVFNICVIHKILNRLGYGSKKNGWLLLLCLFTPAQMIYANLIMSEIILQSFLVGALWCFLKFPNLKYVIFYNLCIAFAAWIKPVMYLFFIPNLLGLGYLSWVYKKHYVWLCAFIPLFTTASYYQYNHYLTGDRHFSSIQNINLLNYNAYYLVVKMEGEAKADSMISYHYREAYKFSSYQETMLYRKRVAQEIIAQYPKTYAWLHGKGILLFFVDPGRFDLVRFFYPSNYDGTSGFLHQLNAQGTQGIVDALRQIPLFLGLMLGIVFIGNILKIVGMLSSLRYYQHFTQLKAFLVIVIGYVAFATGPLGASRFSLPIFPLIVLLILIRKPVKV